MSHGFSWILSNSECLPYEPVTLLDSEDAGGPSSYGNKASGTEHAAQMGPGPLRAQWMTVFPGLYVMLLLT